MVYDKLKGMIADQLGVSEDEVKPEARLKEDLKADSASVMMLVMDIESEFEIEVDSVIMAIGTSPNPLIRSTTPGLEADRHGCLVTKDESGKTSREGVWAGGDAVTGAATVILAMGAGKQAARAIDEALRNR